MKFDKLLLTFKKERGIFLYRISVLFYFGVCGKEAKMKDKYLLLSKCAVNTMCILGIPTTIAVPFFLKWYGSINSHFAGVMYPVQTVMFMIMGIFACLIVFELRSMLKSVEEDNCFIRSNVISLDRMGWYSFMIAVVSCIRLALYVTPGCFVVIVVFVIAGLFSKVLGKVFDKAIEYKEDNELTI